MSLEGGLRRGRTNLSSAEHSQFPVCAIRVFRLHDLGLQRLAIAASIDLATSCSARIVLAFSCDNGCRHKCNTTLGGLAVNAYRGTATRHSVQPRQAGPTVGPFCRNGLLRVNCLDLNLSSFGPARCPSWKARPLANTIRMTRRPATIDFWSIVCRTGRFRRGGTS